MSVFCKAVREHCASLLNHGQLFWTYIRCLNKGSDKTTKVCHHELSFLAAVRHCYDKNKVSENLETSSVYISVLCIHINRDTCVAHVSLCVDELELLMTSPFSVYRTEGFSDFLNK